MMRYSESRLGRSFSRQMYEVRRCFGMSQIIPQGLLKAGQLPTLNARWAVKDTSR
jgi:hypothetical protein